MLTVISDTHIGATRTAGTTPASAYTLRKYILSSYEKLLPESDLLINGDWLDSFAIPTEDLLETYMITSKWLVKGYNLWLSIGNHDLSKDSSKLSSYHLLCNLLKDRFPQSVFLVDKPTKFEYGYILPHCLNQGVFDQELAKVPACDTLYLHCNYENNFAVNSDHSLNVTRKQLDTLNVKQVVIAHEHQMRKVGNVLLPGNQIPTSIADYLNCKGKFKVVDGQLERVLGLEDYAELDWQNPQPTTARFIRFIGHCTPAQASDMAGVIAAYRKASDAFIVSNAVVVSENKDLAELNLASLENIKAFDVMGALKEYLTEDEFKKVQGL